MTLNSARLDHSIRMSLQLGCITSAAEISQTVLFLLAVPQGHMEACG